MIFSPILQRKLHEEDLIDLGSPSFTIPNSFRGAMYEVTEEHVARPDLLSSDLYGDEMYADVICKLNGISNPLELNEGMLIVVPSPDDVDEFIVTPSDLDYKETKVKRKRKRPSDRSQFSKQFTYNDSTKVVVY